MAYYREQPNGKWLARVSFGKGGSTFQRSKLHRTKKLAKAWVRKIEDAYAEGKPLDESDITLSEFLKSWLEVMKPTVRTRTYQSYEFQLTRYVIDNPIGKKKLSKVTTYDVVKLYAEMRNSGLSPRTSSGLSARSIRYTHGLLKAALDYALESDFIAKNPCKSRLIKLPKQETKDIIVLNDEEIGRFIEACGKHPSGLMLETALELGCRVSEYSALRWEDISLDSKTAKITQVVYFPRGQQFEFTPPKTKQARRTIPFSESLRKRLLEHWMKNDAKTNPLNLVFPTSAGTPYRIENLRRRIFKPILKEAGITKHFVLKNLRHTCASLMVRNGVNPKIVQMRLGHSDIATTLKFYTQFAADEQAEAVTSLDNVLRMKITR